MKKPGKILCLCILMIFIVTGPVFSQADIVDLQNALKSFTEAMAKSLPFNSTVGLNWSDAYIGQITGIPPRLGVGITAGATLISMNFIKDLVNEFGDFTLPNIPIGLPLPAYTADIRLGGFILPFDIGFKVGYLDSSGIGFINSLGVNINYLLIGGDIRYALMTRKVIPMKFSIGVGFNHLKTGISTSIFDNSEPMFFGPSNAYGIQVVESDIGAGWQTTCFELKAQVSFPVAFITPYAGAGLSYSRSKVGYQVNSPIEILDDSGTFELIRDFLKTIGVINFSLIDGFESTMSQTAINLRIYGGLSFNMPFFKVDLTAMYNIRDSGFGATIGLRFQL